MLLALMCGVAAARALPTAAQIKTAFEAIDTTKNSAISADEWDRAAFALFHAADKNKNDFIDPEELQSSAIAQDTFLHADTDHDGRLSVAEFMEVRRALFRIADIDRDDHLLYVEFELLIVMEQVGWVDRTRNGRIELSELRESLAAAWDQIDKNHDGFLSAGEAGYMPESQFKRFDQNHDGQLSRDEYIAGYRGVLLGG